MPGAVPRHRGLKDWVAREAVAAVGLVKDTSAPATDV